MALASSSLDVGLPSHLACIGEVGLTGELRPAAQTEKRLQAAAALGLKHCIVARSGRDKRMDVPSTLRVSHVDTLKDAMELVSSC